MIFNEAVGYTLLFIGGALVGFSNIRIYTKILIVLCLVIGGSLI